MIPSESGINHNFLLIGYLIGRMLLCETCHSMSIDSQKSIIFVVFQTEKKGECLVNKLFSFKIEMEWNRVTFFSSVKNNNEINDAIVSFCVGKRQEAERRFAHFDLLEFYPLDLWIFFIDSIDQMKTVACLTLLLLFKHESVR